MSTLFISDLHLDPTRPAVTRAFLDLATTRAPQADALYILGDFFETWIGDDDDAPLARQAVEALHSITRSGTPVYFMRGNRDFLVGQRFSDETGCQLLADPSNISLYNKDVLLMHGDLLCTDDVDYQAFRRQCRSPQWQQAVLGQSLEERRTLATRLRQDSREASSNKPEDIMDVNAAAVADYLTQHRTNLIIHGHTHRPHIHHPIIDGTEHTRIVLGDWDSHSWVLEYFPDHRFELQQAAIR